MHSATERARYHIPVNHFQDHTPPDVAQTFEAERRLVLSPDGVRRSRAVALDRAAALGLPFPATTHTMLARYLQLSPGDPLEQEGPALASICQVLRGRGRSFAGNEDITWQEGDVLVLPAAAGIRHVAQQNALLFCVSDEPLWRWLGVRALLEDKPSAVHYTAAAQASEMERLDQLAERQEAVGRAVIFTRDSLQAQHLTTPFFIANINTLEAGRDQRTHCHNGAAITLSLQGESCSSFVGGQRLDWAPWGVMVTPAGQPHSHHNRGPTTMLSLVVQDSGFYQHARVPGFRFDPAQDEIALRAIDGGNVGIGGDAVARPGHSA